MNGAFVQGFLYRDALRPVAELDGPGDGGRDVRLRLEAERAGLPDPGKRHLPDRLGPARERAAGGQRGTGAVVQRIDYDEFGVVTQDTNPGFQPFGFAGGIYDPDTGLTRFGARDYDPGSGGGRRRIRSGSREGTRTSPPTLGMIR